MTAGEAIKELASRRMRAFQPQDTLVMETARAYTSLANCARVAYAGEALERTLEELRNSGLGELRRRQAGIARDARQVRLKLRKAAQKGGDLYGETIVG